MNCLIGNCTIMLRPALDNNNTLGTPVNPSSACSDGFYCPYGSCTTVQYQLNVRIFINGIALKVSALLQS